ncbi:MAG: YeeE/YedE family protein [Flavobacteriales bacterium]|nr:YeeE/YedE family protein [Flavobacteriales bacterium]
MNRIVFVIAGMVFGIIMVKSEAVSWFRIQEMFRFQSFHMYGIIGSAVVTGTIGLWILRVSDLKNISGARIEMPKKPFLKVSPLLGGIIFGLGWAMTGACPGPLFVNFGAGYGVFSVAILFAILGAFVQGILRRKLPL